MYCIVTTIYGKNIQMLSIIKISIQILRNASVTLHINYLVLHWVGKIFHKTTSKLVRNGLHLQ